MKKRTINTIIQIIILLIIVATFIWLIWVMVFAEVIPFKRTHFRNYHSFWMMGTMKEPDEETILKNQDSYLFPYYEPASTKKNTYYYYTGMFDKFEAVSFMVDEEEYQELYNHYINYFSRFDEIVRIRRQPIPDDFFETENLSFLKKMLDDDVEGYQIVRYVSSGDNDHKNMLGVIGNETTGHIIIFIGHDAFPHNPKQWGSDE